MRVFAPEYYNEFRCIADKCKHSCCIGWEIDIDDETLEFYKNVGGDFGRRLGNSISHEGEEAHFELTEGERCPFLNQRNLCDIISTLGEDKLCNICSDHPRFRNFYSEFAEIGLGLCCEAVGELIFKFESKMQIVEIDTENSGEEVEVSDEEQVFLNFRDRLFGIVQNREKTIEERTEELLGICNIEPSELEFSKWIDVFLELENLNPEWFCMLKEVQKIREEDEFVSNAVENKWEIPFEQLLVYFLYRHLTDGICDGMLRERIAFAVLSYFMIRTVFGALINKHSINDAMECLIEISRMYSVEIEYCEENTYKLFELLSEAL